MACLLGYTTFAPEPEKVRGHLRRSKVKGQRSKVGLKSKKEKA
jgi:hypothetical protein